MGVADFSFATLSMTFCRMALVELVASSCRNGFHRGSEAGDQRGHDRQRGAILERLDIVAPTAPQLS